MHYVNRRRNTKGSKLKMRKPTKYKAPWHNSQLQPHLIVTLERASYVQLSYNSLLARLYLHKAPISRCERTITRAEQL